MEIFDILNKLEILRKDLAEEKELKGGQKKLDKDKDGDIDKHDFAKMRKANEDIENVLRGLQAIQEGDQKVEEDDVEEGNEFAHKVSQLKAQGAKPGTKFKTSDGKEHVLEDLQECGGAMSPLSMPGAMAAQAEQNPDRYTLNIQRGDKSLNVTTDSPEELMTIMKLAGVGGQPVVAQRPAEEAAMHEEWENTPIQTNEREPRAYGDIRDWGFKGTGKGKPGSALNRPAGQGDNPLGETAMMEEYKQFKSGK
jgi:hypothetical protein